MSTERAKRFAESLRNASNIPADLETEMKLPVYVNHEKIRRAQTLFKDNFFAIFYSMYLGLITILAIPSIINVLAHTKKSSSDYTAYKRYMQTIYHTLAWFRNDIRPGTRAWDSFEAVRKMHIHANKATSSANVGMISQKDICITQYGFMGFATVTKEKVGCFFSQEDLENYCHFFRVLGYLIGVRDEYNICAETLEETMERLEVVKSEFLCPALTNPPENFPEMTKFIANGMWCFNPRDGYDVVMFTIKRLINVPNYHYLEDEIPKGYDRSKLELYKLGYYNRFMNWITSFIHEFLLKFIIFRWFFNLQTLFHEFLITYFPFLAMYSFGFNRAYVTILDKKDD